MMRKTSQISNGVKWFAEHAFLFFLVLVLLAFIIGAAVFYKYGILVKGTEPEIKEAPLQFEKDLYQKVLAEWESRGERFKEADTKEYPDPFK